MHGSEPEVSQDGGGPRLLEVPRQDLTRLDQAYRRRQLTFQGSRSPPFWDFGRFHERFVSKGGHETLYSKPSA